MQLPRWSWPIVIIHWVTAILVIGLFCVGYYMVDLDYYDSLYRVLPHWHKSLGLLLLFVTLFRLVYRLKVNRPPEIATISQAEKVIARLVHVLIYLLLFTVFFSGYLISTADGRAIDVFTWFSVPALVTGIPNLEDIAGEVHYWSTYILIAVSLLHAAGAFKHHFVDKDVTLLRMLGITKEVKG